MGKWNRIRNSFVVDVDFSFAKKIRKWKNTPADSFATWRRLCVGTALKSLYCGESCVFARLAICLLSCLLFAFWRSNGFCSNRLLNIFIDRIGFDKLSFNDCDVVIEIFFKTNSQCKVREIFFDSCIRKKHYVRFDLGSLYCWKYFYFIMFI